MICFKDGIGALNFSLALAAFAALGGCGGGDSDGSTKDSVGAQISVSASTPTGALLPNADLTATNSMSKIEAVTASAAATTANSSTSKIVVKASSTIAGGIGSKMNIRVNGQVVGSVEVRSSTLQDFAFDAPAIVRDTVVDIVFTNDEIVGGVDRNLIIGSLTVDGQAYAPNSSNVKYDLGTGAAAFDGINVVPGQSGMYWSGALRFSLAAPAAAASASLPGYYFDQTIGDDGNPGTLEKPWRSLSKLAQVKLKTGEGIYLRCGGIWHESLTLDSTQLTDGSIIAGYGSNCATSKATISGAIALAGGWVKNGNIWSRSVPVGTPKIKRLYVENSAHRVARWPNFTTYSNDFALADNSGAASSTTMRVAAADRTQLQGRDLQGATLQVRDKPFFVDTLSVASYSPADGTLTTTVGTTYPMTPGNGYILQDKAWMLDAPGEFFHDTVANRISIYPATAAQQQNMNSFAVEGAVRPAALKLTGRSGLIVRDIAVTMSTGDGLSAQDTPGIQISGIVASRNYRDGIWLALYDKAIKSTLRSSITNSTIAENWLYGVDGTDMPRLDITNNTVTDTGTVDNAGWSHAALSVGDYGSVVGNTVRGSGYQGIRFSGTGGTVVKNNYVAGYCARFSDCAGIYTWNGPKGSQRTTDQSSVVEANQVLEASANLQGAVGGGSDVVVGIYLDDFSRGVTIRGNWISGVPMGIFLHNASNNTVTQNSVWLSSQAALWASMDQLDADYMTGNIFSNNEMLRVVESKGNYPNLPTITASNAIWFWHQLYGGNSLSSGSNVFSGNRHIEVNGVLLSEALVRSGSGEEQLSTVAWRKLNPSEGALQTPLTYATSTPVTGPELVPGGNFATGMSPWSSWFGVAAQRGTARYLTSVAGCTPGCAQLTAYTRGDMLFSPPFTMTAGIPHIVSYNVAYGGTAMIAYPYISRTVSPWDSFADGTGYVSTSSRYGVAGDTLRYEAYFRPKSSDPAQINLQLETMGVPVMFSNVSIKAVTGFSFPSTADNAKVIHAPRSGDLAVDCNTLGWGSSCTAADSSGTVVALPLRVTAGTSKLLFRSDSVWRR